MKKKFFSRASALAIPALLLTLALYWGSVGAPKAAGATIPEFNGVFVKLLQTSLGSVSADQITKAIEQLSETEQATILQYVGDEGYNAIVSGLPADKKTALDRTIKSAKGKPTGDFKNLCPHILAVFNNALTVEQFRAALDRRTGEEIASMSYYLGAAGRRDLFKAMSEDRIAAILDRSPDWVLIESGNRKWATISGYTATLFKQERVGGDLQDIEKIELKYRNKPHAFYMKWLAGPFKGRELLYNAQTIGQDEIRVREAGLLGVMAVTIDVDSAVARRGSNHMATEIGINNLMGMIEKDYKKAAPLGVLKRVNHGIVSLDGKKVYKLESILPKEKSKGFYCYRAVQYIDYQNTILVKTEIYDWNDQLYESYYYTNIRLSPRFADNDFDPDNPNYGL